MSTTFAQLGSTSEVSGIQCANIPFDSSAKPTSTKPKTHSPIDEVSFASCKGQKPCTIGSAHTLHRLVPSRVGSSDNPPSSMMIHTHHHSCTNAGHHGSCLNQHNLVQLQEQLSLYHADGKAMFGSQETKHKHEAEVAQSVGFDLPKPSAKDFTTMMPMKRYIKEQKCGMGPWTAESRRG